MFGRSLNMACCLMVFHCASPLDPEEMVLRQLDLGGGRTTIGPMLIARDGPICLLMGNPLPVCRSGGARRPQCPLLVNGSKAAPRPPQRPS